MRRWQAIPVAAVVALVVATTLLLQPSGTANAGVPLTQFTVSVDCDPGVGGIQASCNPAAGPYTLDIVATNNSGVSFSVSSLGFQLLGNNQASFTPTVPVSCPPPGLDCNPNFAQATFPGSFNCGAPPPEPDLDASPTATNSFIGCNTGDAGAIFWDDGETIVLSSVSFTASAGVGTFTPTVVTMTDQNFGEIGSCDPIVVNEMTCVGATVQIGGSADTPTPVPPTNTPTATNTPCVIDCAPTTTSTSVAYVTVTGTPTATVPATAPPPGTPVPGGTTAPGAPGGQQPGGTTGGGGRGPISLPDTGTGESNGMDALTIALLAMGAGVVGGGVYFGAAAAFQARRRNGED